MKSKVMKRARRLLKYSADELHEYYRLRRMIRKGLLPRYMLVITRQNSKYRGWRSFRLVGTMAKLMGRG